MLADQGGHWLITHDSAISMLDAFYRGATYRPLLCPLWSPEMADYGLHSQAATAAHQTVPLA